MKELFDINIDTIVLHFDVSNKNVDLKGWWQNKKNKKIYTKKTDVAYYMCNSQFFYLNVQLSLTKLQNGNNAKKFNYIEACDLISIINADLQKTTKNEFFNVDWGQLCRIDLNKDFTFKNEIDANEFTRFLASLPKPRMSKKVKFGSTIAFANSKNRINLRGYRKDVENRTDGKPTVRLEFQISSSKTIRKYFGTDNLINIMLNPKRSCNTWNCMLSRYRLDAAVYNRKQFFKVAQLILGTKKKKFKEYKKILKAGWNNEILTESEKRIYQRIARKLYLCGVTPAYCDVEVSFVQTLSKNFLKKFTKKVFEYFNKIKNRNKHRNKYKSFHNYSIVGFNWLDSS